MVLNSLNVDPRQQWKSDAPWRWYSEEMLNCCIDLETIRKSGITFSMFSCLARCQGLAIDAQFGSDSTIEDFRVAVKKACCDEGSADSKESSDQQTYLVVSYDRQVLQQTGSGHFSPIAAYDEASDKVLILDTARFKYTPHWVSVGLLFTAMLSIDQETNKSRGFLLLSFETDEKHASDSSSPHYHLPQSVLFRSKRSQNPARQKFKDYLKGHANDTGTPFAFQEIFRYWTTDDGDDGDDHRKVWNVLEPSPIPIDKEEQDRVNALVAAIQKLSEQLYSTIDDRSKAKNFAFAPCSARTVHITAIETIYLIYLATIDSEALSKTLGMLSTESFSGYERDLDYIKGQILAEVELIQKAIELSNGDACNCSH